METHKTEVARGVMGLLGKGSTVGAGVVIILIDARGGRPRRAPGRKDGRKEGCA